MKGDTRCVEGRLMRHDPQDDDPDLETDRGVCPECNGAGCDIDAATGTADDQSPVSAAVGLLLDKHDGIHGTNGSRGPTEAETRACDVACHEIMRQDYATFESAVVPRIKCVIISPTQINVSGTFDLLAVVRAVIRSLKPATTAMIDAGSGHIPTGDNNDGRDSEKNAGDAFDAMIEIASPEIKP